MLVVFIPGLGGTALLDAKKKYQVYPSNRYSTLAKHEMTEVEIKTLLDFQYAVGDPIQRHFVDELYGSFVKRLKKKRIKSIPLNKLAISLERKPQKNFLVQVGWDWIRGHSSAVGVARLDAIFNVVDRIGEGQIDVVAIGHSSGALVAMYYAAIRAEHSSNFSRILAVDSPLNGTSRAYEKLTMGNEMDTLDPSGISWAQVWQLCSSPESTVMYELVPRGSLKQLSEFEMGNIDKSKVWDAQEFREKCDSCPVPVVNIIPYGSKYEPFQIRAVPNPALKRTVRVSSRKDHSHLMGDEAVQNEILLLLQ